MSALTSRSRIQNFPQMTAYAVVRQQVKPTRLPDVHETIELHRRCRLVIRRAWLDEARTIVLPYLTEKSWYDAVRSRIETFGASRPEI